MGSYLFEDVARWWPGLEAPAFAAGALITIAFVVAVLRWGPRDRIPTAFLLYLWVGSIALTLARIDVALIDSTSRGPRYFFYPFVFESWLLLHVACTTRLPALRAGAVALLAIAAVDVAPNLSRGHVPLGWATSLQACAAMQPSMRYQLPVETDGRAETAWALPVTGAQCRALLARDVLARVAPPPPLAYVIEPAPEPLAPTHGLAAAAAVAGDGWRGSDFQRTRAPGIVIIGSHRTGDGDLGTLSLRLRRGDRVLFRTGPYAVRQHVTIEGTGVRRYETEMPEEIDWVTLAFDDAALPASFTASFSDDGADWGEWSAVGLRAASMPSAQPPARK